MGSFDTSALSDLQAFTDWIFTQIVKLWNVITSNWILLLVFIIFLLSLVVGLFRLLKNRYFTKGGY